MPSEFSEKNLNLESCTEAVEKLMHQMHLIYSWIRNDGPWDALPAASEARGAVETLWDQLKKEKVIQGETIKMLPAPPASTDGPQAS